MKLTFGIIVLNGDFFLQQVLESIYPYAHRICIAEGGVKYWADAGTPRSTDDTMNIILNFPDPEKKITMKRGTYKEKDDQCRAWFKMVPDDTDYVWCVDADEIHSGPNILKTIDYLKKEQPTSVGFRSDSFYGGFDRIIGGFEQEHSFKRILQYKKGCIYRTHRQPTLALNGQDIAGKDIHGMQFWQETGVTMWHGSYVSPKGVYEKIKYYESAVISKGNCIPNYFENVWMRWVLYTEEREAIEKKYKGVQEFRPETRGECFTLPFVGEHPEVIKKYLPQLQEKFDKQLLSLIK